MEDKNPTDILRKEHTKVLEILDKLENGMESKNIKSMTEHIDVLEKEFDKHSLNKEEKALFPEIEKFIPREGGPTGMMIIEHKELVELIKKFKANIKTNDFEKLNDIGEDILSILRSHIDKENNMLFMMADMHLDRKQKESILKKFKEIDSAMKD